MTWNSLPAPAWDATSTVTITRLRKLKPALERPMVQKQIELMRLRNTHPAFAGEFQVDVPAENQIEIQWKLQEHG